MRRRVERSVSVCPHAKMRVALLTAVTGRTDSRLADRYSTRGSRLWCTWTLYEAARHRLSPSTRRACRVPAKNAARRGYSRRSRERASARMRLRDRRGQRATAAHIDVLLGDSRGRRRRIPRRGGSRSEETSARTFEPSGSRRRRRTDRKTWGTCSTLARNLLFGVGGTCAWHDVCAWHDGRRWR